MRVLLLVSEAPPITSGFARCTEKLTDGLTSLGHDVDVLSSHEIPRWTFGEFRISSFVRHWRSVSRRLSDYDVVNVHGPVPTLSDAFFALVDRIPVVRRPAIVYTHHCSIDLAGLGLACSAYGWLHRYLAQVSDRVLVTSPSYATSIWRRGGPPIDIIPWGVEADQFTPGTASASEPVEVPCGRRLRVLFVGQMRPYKGLDVLLRAVAGQDRLALTVVGSGHLEDHYRRVAATVGTTQADFRGRVSDETLAGLYSQHDVIVLPSVTKAEAFGLVLLEGMAGGCVPVASDLPGVRELAGPTGLIVRPGNVEDLRGALLRLVANPGLVQMLKAASRERAAMMSWTSVAADYEASFERAVASVRSRRAVAALPQPWTTPQWALDTFAARFGASWASLLLFDHEAERRVRAGWGHNLERAEPIPPRIARYVAEHRQPLLLDRTTVRGPVAEWLVRDDVSTALSVPVPARGGARGVLNLSLAAGSVRAFTDRDLEQLTQLVAA